VILAFEMAGESVRMSIQDDGRGLDVENSLNDSKPHFGLSFMNERVDQLGGSIHFESAHPSGTRVLVEIPMDKEKTS
jgi:NarL family two-component system sensor histidine kinase LiaS